jgi:hypothetical protein
MARQNVLTHTGNRLDVVLDNVIVGLCQSARLSDSYALEDASGIGDIHVIEHCPTKAVHSVAVTNMCLFAQSLRGLGGGGYTIDGNDALRGMVFDLVVNAKASGGIGPSGAMRAYIGCSYDSGDVEINAHRITVASGQLKALDVSGTGF